MSDYYSKYVTGGLSKIGSVIGLGGAKSKEKIVETIVKHEYQKLEPFGYNQLSMVSRSFLRVAALSGFTAVIMGAFGSHYFKANNSQMREIFYTAQYYHLLHSVALLAIPLVKRPRLTGSLWVSGLVLFSGTIYYHALTEDGRFRKLTPYGGLCLLAGWLSIMF